MSFENIDMSEAHLKLIVSPVNLNIFRPHSAFGSKRVK